MTIMVSVTHKNSMVSVIVPNVVMLSVVAPSLAENLGVNPGANPIKILRP
jgi:hypothetical protein